MHIVSGIKKGFPIKPPKSDFRPTKAVVREALFNMLDVSNKTFLDLCAGSGAIGFEALSLGASHCTFIDIDRDVVSTLFENAKSIWDNMDSLSIKRVSASQYTKRNASQFDFIYFDPPYDTNIYKETIENIISKPMLSANGILIVEIDMRAYQQLNFLIDFKHEKRKYGATLLLLFQPQ